MSLQYVLFLSTMEHVAKNLPCLCNLLSYLGQTRQIPSPYLRTFHSGVVLSMCIVQKHAMLQCISVGTFGDLRIIDNLFYT
jgi:hypothetical protein